VKRREGRRERGKARVGGGGGVQERGRKREEKGREYRGNKEARISRKHRLALLNELNKPAPA
jgi:hypothetical protein